VGFNQFIGYKVKVIKEFNLKEDLIITDDYEAEENIKGKKIIIIIIIVK
jgi:hypothetical protein